MAFNKLHLTIKSLVKFILKSTFKGSPILSILDIQINRKIINLII